MNGENTRKLHGPVSTTFLRHFIFDGAILLIIKLKFFSGNTDLFFKPENSILITYYKKEKKMPKNEKPQNSCEATQQVMRTLLKCSDRP